jgi:hypothetical protein
MRLEPKMHCRHMQLEVALLRKSLFALAAVVRLEPKVN